jgi:hypothetical protein
VCGTTPIGLTASIDATLLPTPCGKTDRYTYSTSAPASFIRFDVTSGVFPVALASVRTGDYWYTDADAPGQSVSQFVLVRAGTIELNVFSADSTKFGAYKLTSLLNPPFPGCNTVFVTKGVGASFPIHAQSCTRAPVGMTGTFYSQKFLVNMPLSETVSITVSSSAFSPIVEIINQSTGALIASSAAQTGSQVSVVRPAGPAFFEVYVTSRTPGQVGSFAITFSQ